MILSKTPYRVSLFGGGTDYPKHFLEHGGEVLGFAINKFCRVSVRKLPPFFQHRHRVVWSEIELANDLDEIKHPAIREALRLFKLIDGVELHHDGDLPARSGMGSSSSFAVGLINALYALNSSRVTRHALALDAIHLEQDILKENVGWQDQVWAAYGGFNHIQFTETADFEISPVIISPDRKRELIASLMMFYTGVSRFSSEIAGKQISNLDKNRTHLAEFKDMVGHALAVIQDGGSLDDIGHLLHSSWRIKKELASGVTTPLIEEIYAAALSAGALGGKLLGAGGGGFLLFYVPLERRRMVKERLRHLIQVEFDIDYEGSRISIYEPNGI